MKAAKYLAVAFCSVTLLIRPQSPPAPAVRTIDPTFLENAEKAIDQADLLTQGRMSEDYHSQVEQAKVAQVTLARAATTESERTISKKIALLIGQSESCHSPAKHDQAQFAQCQLVSRTRYEVMSLLGVYKIGESWFASQPH